MHAEPLATAGQQAVKRARRPRQPAPRRRTPLSAIRRFNDLVVDFARELGGVDQLSTAERELLRHAATLTLRAEQLAAAVVRCEAVDGDELIRLSGEARRILTGLRKRTAGTRKPAPDLAAYLKAKANPRPPPHDYDASGEAP